MYFSSLSLYSIFFFSLLLLDVCERVCCARGGNLCCYVLYYKRERERLPFVVLEREREEEGVCVLAGVRTVGGLAL